MSAMVKRFGYINRKAPYGSIYAQEMLETVLVASAFAQEVTLIFIDDGVYQLLKDQDPSDIGIKNFSATYKALEHYDVEKIYIEQESLDLRGLSKDDLVTNVEVLDSSQLADMIERQDVLINA